MLFGLFDFVLFGAVMMGQRWKLCLHGRMSYLWQLVILLCCSCIVSYSLAVAMVRGAAFGSDQFGKDLFWPLGCDRRQVWNILYRLQWCYFVSARYPMHALQTRGECFRNCLTVWIIIVRMLESAACALSCCVEIAERLRT
jgi:hypothetical protein